MDTELTTSFEEQIQLYRKLVQQIADLEKKRKELNLIILQQMPAKTISIAGCIVRRYERLLFRTPIEKARELGATKMEEVLDKQILKRLYESGQPIPGVTSSAFIQVSSQKE